MNSAICQLGYQFLSTPSARRATFSSPPSLVSRSNFYPRPPRGGRPVTTDTLFIPRRFLSTPSARRATIQQRHKNTGNPISIHALREEGDPQQSKHWHRRSRFLSTPSARRATLACGAECGIPANFYPRPPRGGRHRPGAAELLEWLISIHALREEGDEVGPLLSACPDNFYPRPPRGGRQQFSDLLHQDQPISIHALREEGDDRHWGMDGYQRNFYPRPPRGGRHLIQALLVGGGVISIHALREEGDVELAAKEFNIRQFLSTPSARRATLLDTPFFYFFTNFYPRPPRGGRRTSKENIAALEKFLSTPSARRATAKTETKSLFSNKLYNILHEFRRALIYNGSKSYPNHAK